MAEKRFRIASDQIRPLAVGHGSCYASDAIVVDGMRVGYMYREEPDNPADSGWRFFSGTESQEYVDNADNLGIYDVNTIANYDTDIIELLESSFPIAFARDEDGHLVEDELSFEDET